MAAQTQLKVSLLGCVFPQEKGLYTSPLPACTHVHSYTWAHQHTAYSCTYKHMLMYIQVRKHTKSENFIKQKTAYEN